MPTHLRRHDEPGHVHFLTISGCRRLPFFWTPDARSIVIECMTDARQRLGFRWIGYVIMPEHVHWLIYPQQAAADEPIPISSVLESLKTSVGMRVKRALREVWADRQTLGRAGLDGWATSAAERKPIWTPRAIDFNVFTYKKLMEKIDYCHRNPVTRGLVDRPEQWPWSSYNHYERAGEVLLTMDWSGTWPLD